LPGFIDLKEITALWQPLSAGCRKIELRRVSQVIAGVKQPKPGGRRSGDIQHCFQALEVRPFVSAGYQEHRQGE
jgi:hypothetical protein